MPSTVLGAVNISDEKKKKDENSSHTELGKDQH